MATLQLKKLTCKRQHDITGKDEVHILVDGAVVWDGVMDKKEEEPLDGGRSNDVDFVSTVDVVLHEVTNGNHDQIGLTRTVDSDPTTAGKTSFKTSGTWYELEYHVVA